MDYKELERIAERSLNGEPHAYGFDRQRAGKRYFEMSLGISTKDRIEALKAKFPGETILVADIGGGTGDMAEVLDSYVGVEAFVIDLEPRIATNIGLGRNRFIKADANSMPHVPDEAFHYLTSFNAMTYMDVPKAVPEAYRILRKGGMADFDWEFPEKGEPQKLMRSKIAHSVSVKATPMVTFHIAVQK